MLKVLQGILMSIFLVTTIQGGKQIPPRVNSRDYVETAHWMLTIYTKVKFRNKNFFKKGIVQISSKTLSPLI